MKRALLALALVLVATPLALASGACSDGATPTPVSFGNDAGAGGDGDGDADAAPLPVPVQLDASEAGPVACGAIACAPADYQGVTTPRGLLHQRRDVRPRSDGRRRSLARWTGVLPSGEGGPRSGRHVPQLRHRAR